VQNVSPDTGNKIKTFLSVYKNLQQISFSQGKTGTWFCPVFFALNRLQIFINNKKHVIVTV
jgi:hypothetical protein